MSLPDKIPYDIHKSGRSVGLLESHSIYSRTVDRLAPATKRFWWTRALGLRNLVRNQIYCYTLATAILLIVFPRIVAVDRSRPQGFDEPAHIAAGMEWLQFHTYHLDPLHPPLARIAISAPLYFAGVRFRETDSKSLPQFWDAGNSILYQNNSYLHNLFLARIGVLVFFAVLTAVLFIWTKRIFGDFAAFACVLLTATLPVLLSFASLAYTDLPATCLQVACLFIFTLWLEKPSAERSIALALLFGLAILSKFTSVLYIPVAAATIFLARHLLRNKVARESGTRSKVFTRSLLMALLSILVIWGGYRFSSGHIDEVLGISPAEAPSFQHFPTPVRSIARAAVNSDWAVPAPSFWVGLGQAWVMNKSAPDAYLLGKHKSGGWWYFFLVESLFKTPIPFLILAMIGLRSVFLRFKVGDWESVGRAIGAATILILTPMVSTNYGLRHVLLVFPLLAIIAGAGAARLWNNQSRWRDPARVAVVVLIAWQCFSALRPGADWIAYFNELAGRDPTRIAVSGCDFDSGQDVLKLARELRRLNVGHLSVAVWTSSDLSRMGLPEFDVLEQFHPQPGWIAVSARSTREGDVLHTSYAPGALSWLNQFQPVARIGSTIALYNIPSINGNAPKLIDNPKPTIAVVSTR